MGELAARLTPDRTAAFVVALAHEKSWEDSCRETGGKWPDGYCIEASVGLRDELAEKLPDVGAELVWGEFEAVGQGWGHAWVELGDGTILDLTAGQFLHDAPALLMVLPGDRLARKYRELERPAW